MGFCEALTIVFVVLKLLDVISWSWWLVLLPGIIAFAFYLFIIVMNIVISINTEKQFEKTLREMRGKTR